MLTLINSTYGTVKGYRRGSLVTLRIDWKSSASGSWNTGNFGTLPESWRPPMDLNFSYGGRDGANQKIINVNANGTMTYANQGWHAGHERVRHDRLIRAMTVGSLQDSATA